MRKLGHTLLAIFLAMIGGGLFGLIAALLDAPAMVTGIGTAMIAIMIMGIMFGRGSN